MEEELRVGEVGARGNTGEGSLANNHSRVPNGKEENDPGTSGGRAAEGIHRWLGSPTLQRLHCSGLFSHL